MVQRELGGQKSRLTSGLVQVCSRAKVGLVPFVASIAMEEL